MTNRTWIGAAFFIIIVVVAALIGVLVFGDDEEAASAGEVVERAAQAQTQLLASIKPDSTLHVVFDEHDPNRIVDEKGPGWNPQNVRKEWWAYFDANGNVADFRAETTDIDTGELIRVTEYENGLLTTTYSVVGEDDSRPLTWTLEALRQQLIDATNVNMNKVVAEADQPAVRQSVGGEDAYVIEEVAAANRERIYIDADSYRPLKVERIENGAVVNTTAMPVFEFGDGNQVPVS